MRRDDTDKKNFFRSPDRVFRMNAAWYFATREGDEGPFASEAQARMESERYAMEKTELAQFQRKREDERVRSSMRVDEINAVPTLEVAAARGLPSAWPIPRPASKRIV